MSCGYYAADYQNDYNAVYEYNAHFLIRKKRHTDTSDNA